MNYGGCSGGAGGQFIFSVCVWLLLHLQFTFKAVGFECMSRQFIFTDVVTVAAITILPMSKLSSSKFNQKKLKSIQVS